MTPTRLIEEEIRRFLKGTSPEVLCITGQWGIGKTYLWKKEVLSAQQNEKIGLTRYAYVSLFGQNSLEALKSAIVEETVDVGSIGKLPDISSLKTPQNWKSSIAGWASRVATSIPGIRDYVIDASRLLFSLLARRQLVCFDDLERAGLGLQQKDVLGLISFLKEERHCRIALLLNQEELEGDSKSDFARQVEKVIDTRLEFTPTPDDAVGIAITGNSIAERHLAKNCKALGLTNIRVIQKIKRLAIRLEEILSGFRTEVLFQAIHSATLFGWSLYQPTTAPSIDFIKTFEPWAEAMEKDRTFSAEEKRERAILRSYNFNRIDEFDEVILRGVRSGFFDESQLKERAKTLDLQASTNQKHNELYEAWRLLRESFTVPADEVMERLEKAFRDGVQTASANDLGAIVNLFKKLGEQDRAKELISFYIEQHKENGRDFFDLKKHPFGSSLDDPDILEAFAKIRSSFRLDRNPADVLQRLGERQGWNPEDVECLAELSADEFLRLFKANSGPNLFAAIKLLLEFDEYTGPQSEDMKHISLCVSDALSRIADESEINSLRVNHLIK
jgi:hypothetical protein